MAGSLRLRPRTARRAAAVATALVVTGATIALSGAGVSTAATGSQATVRWAVTVTGQRVPVRSTFPATPIHPERITHPLADHMGSTIAAHDPAVADGHVTPAASVPQLPGIDVSGYQGNINWSAVAPYIDFVYAKATEGTYYTNPYFTNQYEGPYNAGLIRGAYAFGIPNNASGQATADYFVGHGGGWSSDGKTLPGALDIEYNPYGAECFGLTQSQMVTWVWNFVDEYAAREGVYPVIYSTTDWWTTCTGNYGGFGAYDPLWIANYSASGGGPLPNGWGYYTFWQYASSGSEPGDQDVFNGAYSRLQALATSG